MTTLIPKPKAPENDIDVYLRPLVDEQNELWKNGGDTYDASTVQTFRMHATMLWTIDDFSTYGVLPGWSTMGKLACPECDANTEFLQLKHGQKYCYMGHCCFLPLGHTWRKKKREFDGNIERRIAPPNLMGHDVLEQLGNIRNATFGKLLPIGKKNV